MYDLRRMPEKRKRISGTITAKISANSPAAATRKKGVASPITTEKKKTLD